ncbi:DUF1516 family protein [Lactobacillus sp. CC-MHH1034]|uniref:DUF1516 family protein n=1 Tax=Agrilactobacillus fermenti TaxID=2586909 RepID=UPI001E4E739A|nr:DUF1516 family protein [Agrilactobacillus fermenti]MCD2256423.1 DUF1516 family protein [Agrilactobacillus fermenti]
MPTIVLIHVITAILIAMLTVFGLISTNPSLTTTSKMLDRILYLVLIYSGAVMLLSTFQLSPIWIIIKAALGLAVIALIEIAFAKKQQRQSNILQWLTGIFALTAILGFVISKFFL